MKSLSLATRRKTSRGWVGSRAGTRPMASRFGAGRAGMPISDLLGVRRTQAWATALVILLAAGPGRAESTLRVGGFTLLNKGLVAVGRIPADLRDKFGETFGSGSGMAVDVKSWKRDGAAYSGTVYLLPDRGYNVTGTIDYRSRLNKLSVVLT